MSTATPAIFGRLLRQYWHAAGLTQQDVAERAGLAGRAISDLERGARNRPYRDTVIRLADALGVPEPVRDEFFKAARRVVASSNLDGDADTRAPDRRARDLRPSQESEIRHNLPVPLSSFVGREREMAEVRRLLIGPTSTGRLLTLTGPPGVGKTRLAIEIALDLVEEFADGIVFVPLAAVADPNLVVPAIAWGLAAARNHPERALRLGGAAAAIRLRIGMPIPPDYKAWLERRLVGARQALGESAVAAASAEGQAMTLEQAVDYALEEGGS